MKLVALAALAALSIGLAAMPRPASACHPRAPLVEGPLQDDGATLPANGGIVLTDRAASLPEGTDGADGAALTTDLVTTAGASPVELTRVELARGLAVLQLPRRRAAPRSVRVHDGAGAVVRTFKVTAPAARLPAPRVRRAASDTVQDSAAPNRFGSPQAQVTVELRDAAPPDAYALIVYVVGRKDDWGVTWSDVDPSGTYTLSTGGKSCGGGPPTLYRGARLAFAWLSRDGRVSPHSAPVQLGAPWPLPA
jgi:hypothetical protein